MLTIGLVSDMVCVLIATMQSDCLSLLVNIFTLSSIHWKIFQAAVKTHQSACFQTYWEPTLSLQGLQSSIATSMASF